MLAFTRPNGEGNAALDVSGTHGDLTVIVSAAVPDAMLYVYASVVKSKLEDTYRVRVGSN